MVDVEWSLGGRLDRASDAFVYLRVKVNRQPQQSHQHAGEWTSCLYAMREGSDMNVCHTGAGIPSGAIPGSTSATNSSTLLGS